MTGFKTKSLPSFSSKALESSKWERSRPGSFSAEHRRAEDQDAKNQQVYSESYQYLTPRSLKNPRATIWRHHGSSLRARTVVASKIGQGLHCFRDTLISFNLFGFTTFEDISLYEASLWELRMIFVRAEIVPIWNGWSTKSINLITHPLTRRFQRNAIRKNKKEKPLDLIPQLWRLRIVILLFFWNFAFISYFSPLKKEISKNQVGGGGHVFELT